MDAVSTPRIVTPTQSGNVLTPRQEEKSTQTKELFAINPPRIKDGKKTPKSKTKPLYFWSCADVNKWMKKHGGQFYDLYGQLLLNHELTGRTLIRLNDYKLEQMGLTNVEHRRLLLNSFFLLRLKHEQAEIKTLDQKGSGFELKLPEIKP